MTCVDSVLNFTLETAHLSYLVSATLSTQGTQETPTSRSLLTVMFGCGEPRTNISSSWQRSTSTVKIEGTETLSHHVVHHELGPVTTCGAMEMPAISVCSRCPCCSASRRLCPTVVLGRSLDRVYPS